MIDHHHEIARLKSVCALAEPWEEGGVLAVFLPGLKVVGPQEQAHVLDALLWPHARDGYPTRLYLERVIPNSSTGVWTQSVIMGRTWHVLSWRDVPASLPWIEILSNHMRPFQ